MSQIAKPSVVLDAVRTCPSTPHHVLPQGSFLCPDRTPASRSSCPPKPIMTQDAEQSTEWVVKKDVPIMLVGLSLSMALVGALFLYLGINEYCHKGELCVMKWFFYITGICCSFSAVGSLFLAIFGHIMNKKTMKKNATEPPQPLVDANPSLHSAAYPAMQKPYPPPHPPPGPTAYTLGSPGVQSQAPVGLNAAQQPTQGTTQGDSQLQPYAPGPGIKPVCISRSPNFDFRS